MIQTDILQAGALIKEDLSQADIILGIKEVPSDMLLAGKRYMFFSHTHKSQSHNMPMLKSILDKVTGMQSPADIIRKSH